MIENDLQIRRLINNNQPYNDLSPNDKAILDRYGVVIRYGMVMRIPSNPAYISGENREAWNIRKIIREYNEYLECVNKTDL